MAAHPFDGVAVFSTTMRAEHATLGERVTAWLASRPNLRVGDIVVRQSSCDRYHCFSLVVFYVTR
ncbi:MAG TPA: hypothetical protein VGG28_24205 [Kofleriaceae bacterium]